LWKERNKERKKTEKVCVRQKKINQIRLGLLSLYLLSFG
jgi:hypothetical protein